MNEKQTRTLAAIGLFVGGIFAMIGSVVSSPSFRGLAWGLDGVGLILVGGLLTVYYFKKAHVIAFFVIRCSTCCVRCFLAFAA